MKIINVALRASLAIYHLISNALSLQKRQTEQIEVWIYPFNHIFVQANGDVGLQGQRQTFKQRTGVDSFVSQPEIFIIAENQNSDIIFNMLGTYVLFFIVIPNPSVDNRVPFVLFRICLIF